METVLSKLNLSLDVMKIPAKRILKIPVLLSERKLFCLLVKHKPRFSKEMLILTKLFLILDKDESLFIIFLLAIE